MPKSFRGNLQKAIFITTALFVLMMALLPQPPINSGMSDKWLHAVAFTVLTILARLAFPNRRVFSVLLALSLLGGFIELVQAIPALGRDASLADWAADVLAVTLTLGLLRALQGFSVPPNTSQKH